MELVIKWLKLGKIFAPEKHILPNNCSEFAQSPQVLIKKDRVRIYFSTRVKDNVGKYLSHVAYVDFNKELSSILDVSTHTVIELGGLGCFDEHGIFPFNVFDDGDKILAYTSGWNRKVSVLVDSSIGFAVSYNGGYSFEKHGTGPILSSSLHEPFLVADAFVSKYEGIYHMWYIFGTKWKKFSAAGNPERIYKIAHATSKDKINWKRDGQPIIADKLNEDECQALPSVFYHKGMYHMYFCYRQADGFRENKEKSYRIGYAVSEDLVSWKRDDNLAGIDVSENGWDSQMQCYPHVFDLDGKVYMLYNGNSFGRYGFGLAMLDN
ncbi:hypothetical protein [Kiloniella majae]|uniref:hypothetical protein n=1 Tax=Kiloniella majae TaxID=1938558 RepID=UPI000A27966D|nr:hypothetical protein [Kiloniella majae]